MLADVRERAASHATRLLTDGRGWSTFHGTRMLPSVRGWLLLKERGFLAVRRQGAGNHPKTVWRGKPWRARAGPPAAVSRQQERHRASPALRAEKGESGPEETGGGCAWPAVYCQRRQRRQLREQLVCLVSDAKSFQKTRVSSRIDTHVRPTSWPAANWLAARSSRSIRGPGAGAGGTALQVPPGTRASRASRPGRARILVRADRAVVLRLFVDR